MRPEVSRLRVASPTGEREPGERELGERAHLRTVSTAGDLPGSGDLAALRTRALCAALRTPALYSVTAPLPVASPGGRCPLRAGLSRSRALLLQHRARGYLGLGVQKAPGLGELGQRAGHIPASRGAEFISRLKGLRIQSLCEPRASAWGPGDLGQGQGLGLGKRRSQGP